MTAAHEHGPARASGELYRVLLAVSEAIEALMKKAVARGGMAMH